MIEEIEDDYFVNCPACGGTGTQIVRKIAEVTVIDERFTDKGTPTERRFVTIEKECELCNGSGIVHRSIVEHINKPPST